MTDAVCRNPLCEKRLRSDNTTGFCRTCVKQYPGRRWYLLSRKDWPRYHRRRLEYMRNYRVVDRRERRAAGICTYCPQPAGGKTRCRGCLDKTMEWQRRRRAWKRSLREAHATSKASRTSPCTLTLVGLPVNENQR